MSAAEFRGLNTADTDRAWWQAMPDRLTARRNAERAHGYPIGSPERRALEVS